MSIWKTKIDLELLNARCRHTLMEHLGIEFVEVGDNFLTAKMPVDQRTKQPIGILHGGATCALAETVGSSAANFCVDMDKHYCVGLDININHLRIVKSGFVRGIAHPFHLGKTTHVWEIKIFNDENKLTAISRLTMKVLDKIS